MTSKIDYSWKQYYKPFKLPKEEKKVIQPRVITLYEQQLISILEPVIRNKQLLKFWYEDETSDIQDWRIIEPHSVGQTKYKTANILLTGWFLPTQEQVMFGHYEDWKNYILYRVKKIEILTETFRLTRPGYKAHQDSRMIKMFCATTIRNW